MRLVLIQSKSDEKCMKILQIRNKKKKEKEILKNLRLRKSLKCLMTRDKLDNAMKADMRSVFRNMMIQITAFSNSKSLSSCRPMN
jgi:hypothetical protein